MASGFLEALRDLRIWWVRARPLPIVAASVLACWLALGGPPAAAQEDIPILADAAASSALRVQVEGRCSDQQLRGVEAVVSWKIAPAAKTTAAAAAELLSSRELAVDLTMYPRGFERNEFERVPVPQQVLDRAQDSQLQGEAVREGEPLSPSLVLADLRPGIHYSTRLLVRTAQGYVASEVVHFTSPICFADMVDEDGRGER